MLKPAQIALGVLVLVLIVAAVGLSLAVFPDGIIKWVATSAAVLGPILSLLFIKEEQREQFFSLATQVRTLLAGSVVLGFCCLGLAALYVGPASARAAYVIRFEDTREQPQPGVELSMRLEREGEGELIRRLSDEDGRIILRVPPWSRSQTVRMFWPENTLNRDELPDSVTMLRDEEVRELRAMIGNNPFELVDAESEGLRVAYVRLVDVSPFYLADRHLPPALAQALSDGWFLVDTPVLTRLAEISSATGFEWRDFGHPNGAPVDSTIEFRNTIAVDFLGDEPSHAFTSRKWPEIQLSELVASESAAERWMQTNLSSATPSAASLRCDRTGRPTANVDEWQIPLAGAALTQLLALMDEGAPEFSAVFDAGDIGTAREGVGKRLAIHRWLSVLRDHRVPLSNMSISTRGFVDGFPNLEVDLVLITNIGDTALELGEIQGALREGAQQTALRRTFPPSEGWREMRL